MKIIERLSNQIEEELCDAQMYIEWAMECKETMPGLAAALHKISLEEMGHVDILHTQVVNIISEYRKTNGDPPKEMMWVYEYLHKKHIKKANDIKVMQGLFKG